MNPSTSTDRIEKSIELKAPVAKVWQALTDYQEFSEWFGATLAEPFVPGKPTRGKFGCDGRDQLEMELVVQKMEAEQLFSFHWHPYSVNPAVDYSQETPTLVEFKLQPISTGTLLTVIESGFDSIPVQRRAEAFRMHNEGWTKQLENISAHVAPGS